jgi:hypothetical protein
MYFLAELTNATFLLHGISVTTRIIIRVLCHFCEETVSVLKEVF